MEGEELWSLSSSATAELTLVAMGTLTLGPKRRSSEDWASVGRR